MSATESKDEGKIENVVEGQKNDLKFKDETKSRKRSSESTDGPSRKKLAVEKVKLEIL